MRPFTYQGLGQMGRLGNMLWQIAGTVGVARTEGRPVVFPADWPYRPWFCLPDEWFDAPGRPQDVVGLMDPSLSRWERVYMQNPDLWADCADEIRDALRPSPRAVAVLDALPQPGPMDVAVHVRRTDYLGMPDHLPVQPAQYYRSARASLERLLQAHNALDFHVYGDDLEWTADHLPDFWQARRYGADNGEPTDWADLQMMVRYRHHIIANSSYSWWAAWLSGDDHVCYPTRWYGPKIDVPHPCPSHWIGVSGESLFA